MNSVVCNRLLLALALGASATAASGRAFPPLVCDAVSPPLNFSLNQSEINALTQETDAPPQTFVSFESRENAALKTASNWSADWLFAVDRLAPLNQSRSNASPRFPSCPNGACPFDPASPTLTLKPKPPQGIVRAIVRVYNAYEESVSGGDASFPPARRRVVEKGSGALVADSLGTRYVLTAAHIFRDGRGEIAAQTTDGRVFPATLVLASEECDVALLRVDAPADLPTLTVATAWPRQGETVWRAGFGPDETLKELSGVVKGYVKTDRYASYETLKIDGPARQGDSGGPVYNAAGEIVGVVWGTDGTDAYATYCGRVLKTLRDYSPTFAPVGAPLASQSPVLPRLPERDATPSPQTPRVPKSVLNNDKTRNNDATRRVDAPPATVVDKFRDYYNAALAFALVFAFGYCGFFAGKQR